MIIFGYCVKNDKQTMVCHFSAIFLPIFCGVSGEGKAEVYDSIKFQADQNLPPGFKPGPGHKAGFRAPELFLPFPILPSRWPQSLAAGPPPTSPSPPAAM